MIPLPGQVLLALLLDFLIGDPRWFPHPVKGIGRLAAWIEQPCRRLFSPRTAGIVAVLAVVTISTGLTWYCCRLASIIHPLCGDVASIVLLSTCFALQDLRQHALQIFRPLTSGNLVHARKMVAMIVGRDTDSLEEEGIVRATVESVAENTVDGVTAPLIFAFIAGAPGAMFYKAVNTLDSTWGHKNTKYLYFGWAAARLDDLTNFLPARITALLVPLAAQLTKLNGARAWRIFRRDRHCHPSPNGGQIESAFAGALNIRLGGEISYSGAKSFRPYLGVPTDEMRADKITAALRLMIATTLCVTTSCILFNVLIM